MVSYCIVTSGKGGVGKSTFCAGIASMLAKKGKKVCLIDADAEGPNQSRIMGVQGQQMTVDKCVQPVKVNDNLLLFATDLHTSALDSKRSFRLLAETHRNFIREFIEAAQKQKPDYIILDMPANDGNPTYALKFLIQDKNPKVHVVIVTAPNQISADNVRETIKTSRDMGFHIIGIVENFSRFICDGCQKEHWIFGKGVAQELCQEFHVPFLGDQPLMPDIATNMDGGKCINNPIVERIIADIEKKPSFWHKITGGG